MANRHYQDWILTGTRHVVRVAVLQTRDSSHHIASICYPGCYVHGLHRWHYHWICRPREHSRWPPYCYLALRLFWPSDRPGCPQSIASRPEGFSKVIEPRLCFRCLAIPDLMVKILFLKVGDECSTSIKVYWVKTEHWRIQDSHTVLTRIPQFFVSSLWRPFPDHQ